MKYAYIVRIYCVFGQEKSLTTLLTQKRKYLKIASSLRKITWANKLSQFNAKSVLKDDLGFNLYITLEFC